jgi:hypothetical protein
LQGHRWFVDKGSPPKRLAKASASSDLEKQNTTKSLSSLRVEYVSGVAYKTPAAQNITYDLLGVSLLLILPAHLHDGTDRLDAKAGGLRFGVYVLDVRGELDLLGLGSGVAAT